jgi:hypothetical protein
VDNDVVVYAQVHCGFMKNSGADMDDVDMEYIQKCKFVVASGIFDGYDVPHQPSNVSLRSQKLFCFLMVVDEVSLDFIENNITVKVDGAGGKWVGIWRLITLHHLPFDEPRRNGKVPKILTHRLFPRAWYSIWIDGKMELMVDPLLILERSIFICNLKQILLVCCWAENRFNRAIIFTDTSGGENTHLQQLSISIIGAYMRRVMQSNGGSDMLGLWLIFS